MTRRDDPKPWTGRRFKCRKRGETKITPGETTKQFADSLCYVETPKLRPFPIVSKMGEGFYIYGYLCRKLLGFITKF